MTKFLVILTPEGVDKLTPEDWDTVWIIEDSEEDKYSEVIDRLQDSLIEEKK